MYISTILSVRHQHFFFFQAEDGIRDYKVTGVQTCALPISLILWDGYRHTSASFAVSINLGKVQGLSATVDGKHFAPGSWVPPGQRKFVVSEIGRASCRERV